MYLEINLSSCVFDMILIILGGIVRNMFSTVEPLLEKLRCKKYRKMVKVTKTTCSLSNGFV